VLPGLAVTLAPVVAVKLVFGVQVYVEAPLPVKVAEPPAHIETGPLIPKVGVAFTVMTTVCGVVAAQPAADVPFKV